MKAKVMEQPVIYGRCSVAKNTTDIIRRLKLHNKSSYQIEFTDTEVLSSINTSKDRLPSYYICYPFKPH